MRIEKFGASKWFVMACLSAVCGSSFAANPAWRNPYLADSIYPISHGSPAQQDSVAVAGPAAVSHTLGETEIQFADTGPGTFGAVVSAPYLNGKRVIWCNSLDRITKIDESSFEILSRFDLPDVKRYTVVDANESTDRLEKKNEGVLGIINAARDMGKMSDLSGMYTLVDRENVLFVGNKQGYIQAYADADPKKPKSSIVALRRYDLPEEVTGNMVGMNMTPDGWLLVVTTHGYVIAVKRDFSASRLVRMKYSEAAESDASQSAGGEWIRNSFAVDEDGGIYVASQDRLHKIVWVNKQLTTDESAGAWTAQYSNELGIGTGATPSLMGFGDEDRFVVITDGSKLMNLVLFWRDEIPSGWKSLPGEPSHRIAAVLPVNMGDAELEELQSEQSIIISGYGAMVVNNEPRNIPWYLSQQMKALLLGALGSSPRYQPFGVQKLEWNAQAKKLEYAWVNKTVSSPNSVPIVSTVDNRVYLIGARNNKWTLEALDWSTGESIYHLVIGGQSYNSMFTGTRMDQQGNIHYGTSWGRVRITPNPDYKLQ
jgi:hypothetical protein